MNDVFDADLSACAELVQRADPDRFAAAMAAPVAARRVLFPLYALAVEVARAPWASAEPMIAEMRLQWWRDALEELALGKPPRRHPVVTPLAGILSPQMAARLDGFVAVRRWDIYRDPFEDDAHLTRYLEQSSASLLCASAAALGQADEDVLRDYGYATGLANWFRAIPELEARGRIPLLDGSPAGIRRLAEEGLDRLSRARAKRALISLAARPALLAGWQSGAVLRQLQQDPGRVATGQIGLSPFARHLRLSLQAMTGRW
ncbi:squalene/phytoene synthase family protein [Ruegeria aquimaris]|uniref:Squalene/phytoene synthase family protein n=1 Tax=Ruegeria aquimaris TaxID=2984333 RepID=A0ABT3AML4_9RHOB|nr:squalene/phytoene synthase family protein [Ruegeria sp. XHP0148]MCV2889932.1 squalene/phytoene synthase family protein [Ruegeria sp. XHP0148]